MEVNETKIEDMIEDEIKTDINIDDPKKIMPRNYAYILAYFTSIFNKYKKANINNIPDLIDAWIDADMFEIQIYYEKNDMTRFGRISRCTCYRESPINSTFCCNCNMIKLLYKKDNISDLLKLYPKNKYSSWHIMLDDYIIYQGQYEKIVSDFVKHFKKKLKNLYTK